MSDTIYVVMVAVTERDHQPTTSVCELLGLYRSHQQAVARAARYIHAARVDEPSDWVQSDDDLLEWFNCTQADYYIDVQPSAVQQEVLA